MKESQISDALRESMNAVRLSPALRARALCAMRGSEERRPKMKRKFSAALAFALVGVLVVAVALAVANRKGVLDFLSYSEATLPENAGDYVQTDIASDERDGLHAAVREVVYDGHRLWATVDINMDGEKPLLTGLDYGLDDEEKWAWLRHDESETDDRSILDVYREEGYTDACYIAASIYDEDDDPIDILVESGHLIEPGDGALSGSIYMNENVDVGGLPVTVGFDTAVSSWAYDAAETAALQETQFEVATGEELAALQSRVSERLQQKLISLLSLIPAEFLELLE